MEEIDSMEKLDDALRWSVENNQPVVIDWYESASLLVVAHVARPAMISLYSIDLSGFRMLIVIRVESR
jgi:hypothetical protein